MARGGGRGTASARRGPSTSSPRPCVENEFAIRTIVHVESNRLLPSHQVSAQIRKIFKQKIHERGYCWKKVPGEYRNIYFQKFKKYFTWDESIDESVYCAFINQAPRIYRELVNGFKSKRHLGRPKSVPKAAWPKWLEYWNRPDVIRKSEIARKNRMSEVAGEGTGCSRHTGGSRTTIEHAHALRAELKHEPLPHECFMRTHKRKDGTLVDERSRLVAEAMEERVAAATQRAEEMGEPPAIDMRQLYLEVVGGVQKERVYGLGSKSYEYCMDRLTASRAVSQETLRRQVAEDMQQNFRLQMEEKEARLRGEFQAERAEMEGRMAEMKAQMARMMEDLRCQGRAPPHA